MSSGSVFGKQAGSITVRIRSASSSCSRVSAMMRYGLFPSAHISPHQACCRSSFWRRFGSLDSPAFSLFSASLGRPIHGTSTARGASSLATLGVASTCRPCSSCQAACSLSYVGRISSVVSTRIIFCPLAPARLASSGACALRGAVPWASASRRPCAAARRTGAWPVLRFRRQSRPFRVAEQHPAEVSRAGCVRLLSLPPAFPSPPWTGPAITLILCACPSRRKRDSLDRIAVQFADLATIPVPPCGVFPPLYRGSPGRIPMFPRRMSCGSTVSLPDPRSKRALR